MKTSSVLPSEYLANFLLEKLKVAGRGDYKQHHNQLVEIACKDNKPCDIFNDMLAYLTLKNCGKHQDLRRDIYTALCEDETWKRIRRDEDDSIPVYGTRDESIKILSREKSGEYLVRDTWTESGKLSGSPFRTSSLKMMAPGELGTRMAQCVELACRDMVVVDGIAEVDRAVAELTSLADAEVLMAFDEQAKALRLVLPARKFDPFEL